MIFATVGAQMPFDRMMRTVDSWAAGQEEVQVLAQIGTTSWRPKSMQWVQTLDPCGFRRACKSADLIVSHAGMGTILTAMELDKPILVMPRRAELHETRNDHQFATVRRLGEVGRLAVACDERELLSRLDHISQLPCLRQSFQSHHKLCNDCTWSSCRNRKGRIQPSASFELLAAIRRFIETGSVEASLVRLSEQVAETDTEETAISVRRS